MNTLSVISKTAVEIYTDGSCNSKLLTGGWAAILFIEGQKIVLSGKEFNTTHNRMELTAVIKAIEYVRENCPAVNTIHIISDSQYVTGLKARGGKISAQSFITKKGNEMRNADLLKVLLAYFAIMQITFLKIKAHQKKNDIPNYNIEADRLSREIVRKEVKTL